MERRSEAKPVGQDRWRLSWDSYRRKRGGGMRGNSRGYNGMRKRVSEVRRERERGADFSAA